MPTKGYVRNLLPGQVRLRAEWETVGNYVVGFVVQLEAWHEGKWKPVRRYDNAHGYPHRDSHDRWGKQYNKEWLPGSPSDVLTQGIQDIGSNWEGYVKQFLED